MACALALWYFWQVTVVISTVSLSLLAWTRVINHNVLTDFGHWPYRCAPVFGCLHAFHGSNCNKSLLTFTDLNFWNRSSAMSYVRMASCAVLIEWLSTTLLYSEWVRFNVPLDTLQVILETVLQAITCTHTDNKNLEQNQSNLHKIQ